MRECSEPCGHWGGKERCTCKYDSAITEHTMRCGTGVLGMEGCLFFLFAAQGATANTLRAPFLCKRHPHSVHAAVLRGDREGGSCGRRPHGGSVGHWDEMTDGKAAETDWPLFTFWLAKKKGGGSQE